MSAFKITSRGRIRHNSLLISLLAGIFRAETGSTWTASATTQFRKTGEVLTGSQLPRIGGLFSGGLFLPQPAPIRAGEFVPFVSAVGKPVPGSKIAFSNSFRPINRPGRASCVGGTIRLAHHAIG